LFSTECRLLFWSDIGAVCKIEYSRLDGTERANFLDVGLDKPLGMTIDYVNDRLYWVDDFLGTIEHVDIATASNRVTIRLSDLGIVHPRLFGIALYKVI
jgi:Low-density lipoprotein receptor repeat class B